MVIDCTQGAFSVQVHHYEAACDIGHRPVLQCDASGQHRLTSHCTNDAVRRPFKATDKQYAQNNPRTLG